MWGPIGCEWYMLCTKHAWNTFSGEMIQDGKENSNPCAGRECSHGGLFLCWVTCSFESLKYRALLSCPFFVEGALGDMKVTMKILRQSHYLKFCVRMKTHTVSLLSLFRLTLIIMKVTWILNDFHIKREQYGQRSRNILFSVQVGFWQVPRFLSCLVNHWYMGLTQS